MAGHHPVHFCRRWLGDNQWVQDSLALIGASSELLHIFYFDRIEGVGPEIGVIPVRMREIEINADAVPMRGIAQFLNDVTLEGTLHNAVGQVAVLQPWTPGSGPVGAPFHASLGIEHREA